MRVRLFPDPTLYREARKSAGLTQGELAARLTELVGTTVRTQDISRYENGHAEPSASRLSALAHALRVEITDLCREELTEQH